jgi:hypothetical protein
MIVDSKWVERNLGFDPTKVDLPASTFALPLAAKSSKTEDLQREIIDFDSESPQGKEFLAFTTATGLSRYTDVVWPRGLAPKVGSPAGPSGRALPRADVLLVTWTVDEGHALSRVLTPGKDSRNDYLPYTHNYAAISRRMRAGCPAVQAKRLGAFWTTKIGQTSVVVFKSDSHMSQDGPKLPNIDVWRQIILEVAPKLVITTGTAGGIGREFEVGDVIVSPIVRFDCLSKFSKQAFAKAHYVSAAPKTTHFATARELFKANAAQLPKGNTRQPKIFRVPATVRMFCSSLVIWGLPDNSCFIAYLTWRRSMPQGLSLYYQVINAFLCTIWPGGRNLASRYRRWKTNARIAITTKSRRLPSGPTDPPVSQVGP